MTENSRPEDLLTVHYLGIDGNVEDTRSMKTSC